jgi:hypothetical protein
MRGCAQIYESAGANYSAYFEASGDAASAPIPDLIPTARSFKILAEAPLQVMFLINLYSRTVNNYIPLLAPLMVSAVSLRGA